MARVLVDTHALLWWLGDDAALPTAARRVIADPETAVLVSAASMWEAAIKRALGKLEAPDDLPRIAEEEGFEWLAVGPEHAWDVRGLPLHHTDPFDRLLIAQARREELPVVTGDDRFAAYGVDVRWG